MNAIESIAIFTDMKATFSDAVVSVAIRVGDNETVTADGIRTGVVKSRVGSGRGGLRDSADLSVLVLKSSFPDAMSIYGKTGTITKGDDSTVVRLVSSKEHALGGLITLIFGDYDRVTA